MPDEIGLVTIDNDYFAQSSLLPLTTAEQPTLDVGRRVVEVLLRLIDGEPIDRVTMLPRGSSIGPRPEPLRRRQPIRRP